MNERDKGTFYARMMAVAETFDKKMSDEQLKIYYEVLQDLTIDEFSDAMTEVLRTHKYNSLPKPAAFLEAANGTKEDNAMMLEHEATMWWGIVYRNINGDESVSFDPTVNDFIKHLGGWPKFCSMETKQLEPFIRLEFINYYKDEKMMGNPGNTLYLGARSPRPGATKYFLDGKTRRVKYTTLEREYPLLTDNTTAMPLLDITDGIDIKKI